MGKALMFVGSANHFLPYVAQSRGAGISAYRIDVETGAAEALGTVGDIHNPTFVSVAPDGGSLLATSEIFGEVLGLVSAFSVERRTGGLTFLAAESTGGFTPANASFDSSGRYAAVVNYGDVPATAPLGTSVAIYRRAGTGSIGPIVTQATHTGSGPDTARQDRPHAHCVRWTPDGRFVVVADLGIDRLVIYRFDVTNGALERHGEVVMPAGSGPRHFAFHPAGALAYVICELSSSVVSFAFEAGNAAFRLLASESTLPPGTKIANGASAIQIAPNGRHLFAGNRGHDSIARFDIDASGIAHFVEAIPSGGQTPRDFAFDPSERILAVANQSSDVVTLFRYDPQSGTLTPLGAPIATGSPTAIAFHPTLD